MACLQDNDLVVIVGAGSVGLSTAYNLAKMSSQKSLRIEIILLEAFRQPFAASSSTCSGCFHYAMGPQIKPLGKYSFDLWANESKSDDFHASTGYRTQSSLGVTLGAGKQLNTLPDWVHKQIYWDIDTGILGTQNATVNPMGLGRWLINQCRMMGVRIETGAQITDIELSTSHEVEAIGYWDENKGPIRLGCKQVLLACGPWTPSVFKKLFPSSKFHLHPVIDAEDWVSYKSPSPILESNTAFVSFTGLIDEKVEFAGRNDDFIWACGPRNVTATLPSPGQYDNPDNSVIKNITQHGRKYLKGSRRYSDEHRDEIHIVSKGRSFRSTTGSGLPMISEVPASLLTADSRASGDAWAQSHWSGVFMCWGHGAYGLTLSIGSGRLMSQLMLRKKPDIDISAFSALKHHRHSQDLLAKDITDEDAYCFV